MPSTVSLLELAAPGRGCPPLADATTRPRRPRQGGQWWRRRTDCGGRCPSCRACRRPVEGPLTASFTSSWTSARATSSSIASPPVAKTPSAPPPRTSAPSSCLSL